MVCSKEVPWKIGKNENVAELIRITVTEQFMKTFETKHLFKKIDSKGGSNFFLAK